MAERVVLQVGTVKGVYRFESDGERRSWRVEPPLLPEWRVDSILTDPADPDHLLVGTSHEVSGRSCAHPGAADSTQASPTPRSM
jgi:hypothetical protein